MSADHSVTKEGMLQAAHVMEAALAVVDRNKAEVMAAVDRTAATFTGDAAIRFRSAMKGWVDNVDTINRELSEMAKIMNQGAQTVGKASADTGAAADDGARAMAGSYAAGLTGL